MKASFYNHYISQSDVIIYFNAMTDAHLLLKANIFTAFKNNMNDLQEFQSQYPNQYRALYENGFIVDNDFNEKEYYKNLYYERKYTRNSYFLIINPTLTCNLGCWYCYESHKEHSELTGELFNAIIQHIKQKYELDKFRQLGISFFGGEPMLKPKIVEELINQIKQFATEKEIKFSVSFTTNATIMPVNLLNVIKEIRSSFQITFDGNREMHNTIRKFKQTGKNTGSYDLILKHIRLITDTLTNYRITIRVNFAQQTLEGLTQIVDDLDFCDRKRTTINLHKVWQADVAVIDRAAIFEFINYAKQHNFIVRYMDIYPNLYACYADNYNEAVINYNGDVFKCTARDFSTIEPDGKLIKNGAILWNTDRWLKRIDLRIPEICENCNLLPACGGLCSQARLERGKDVKCKLDSDFTKEDYIIHNLNRQLLTKKIKAL